MNDKNRKLHEARRGGRIDTPLDRNPIKTSGVGGQVKTNWANIRWTKKKLTFVSLLLGTPYVIALVVSWVAINRLITYILLLLALLCVLLVWFLRSVDNEEF